ncbi:MAG: heavy metal-binding domain-containing protein [Acutalibacteraceae bacterium]
MQVFTIESIPNRKYEPIALVEGGMVQSKHIGKDIGASFKTLVGGELKGYTEMMQEARAVALQRLVDNAAQYNADAVIGLRYATSAIVQGAAEVIAYGTAVRYID